MLKAEHLCTILSSNTCVSSFGAFPCCYSAYCVIPEDVLLFGQRRLRASLAGAHLRFTDAFLFLCIAVGVRAAVRVAEPLRCAQRRVLGRIGGSECPRCAIAIPAAAGRAVWRVPTAGTGRGQVPEAMFIPGVGDAGIADLRRTGRADHPLSAAELEGQLLEIQCGQGGTRSGFGSSPSTGLPSGDGEPCTEHVRLHVWPRRVCQDGHWQNFVSNTQLARRVRR